MSFTGDPVARKTYDPDAGLELFADRGGPDGYETYRIIHSSGAGITFTTRWEPEFWARWTSSHPKAINPIVYVVRSLRGILPGMDRAQTDAVIVEALSAFRARHGKPVESEVAVFFEEDVEGELA